MMRLRGWWTVALGLTIVGLLGCKTSVTPIKTLLDDPARFDKQTVQIVGDVEESAGLMGYGGYRVNDGTGTIAVVTNTNGAPRTGAHVGVQGEFRQAFTLGTTSAAVIMEKQRFTP
jgi:hypothetical protein